LLEDSSSQPHWAHSAEASGMALIQKASKWLSFSGDELRMPPKVCRAPPRVDESLHTTSIWPASGQANCRASDQASCDQASCRANDQANYRTSDQASCRTSQASCQTSGRASCRNSGRASEQASYRASYRAGCREFGHRPPRTRANYADSACSRHSTKGANS
jgi:hypothetical protein